MGATTFLAVGKGETAADAFSALVSNARYLHGHGGYTGTIAEKTGFIEFTVPPGVTAKQLVDWVESFPYDEDNPETPSDVPFQHIILVRRIFKVWDDKWGPAACLKVAEGKWLFFGWASE